MPETREGFIPPEESQESKEKEPQPLNPEMVKEFLDEVADSLAKANQIDSSKEDKQRAISEALGKITSAYKEDDEGNRLLNTEAMR